MVCLQETTSLIHLGSVIQKNGKILPKSHSGPRIFAVNVPTTWGYLRLKNSQKVKKKGSYKWEGTKTDSLKRWGPDQDQIRLTFPDNSTSTGLGR